MTIVVATDGSRGGTAAVQFGARLAARDSGSRLIVITIAGRPNLKGKTSGDPASPDRLLAEAAKEILTMGHTRCECLALRTRREIPEAISAFADRVRADLVVVGSEGRDTLSEWVVGGVALRLIYVASRPVLVVRPRRRRGRAAMARPLRGVDLHPKPADELFLGNSRPHLPKRGGGVRDRLV